MSKDVNLSEIEAAADAFKDAILSSREVGTKRFPYSKNKQSQAEGSTANVVTIEDKANDSAYTISVNISAIRREGKKTFKTDDRLDVLQAAVKKFLESIHEEL